LIFLSGGKLILRKKKKIKVFFIFFLIILSFTNQIITSNVEAKQSKDTNTPKIGFLYKILARMFGRFMTLVVPIFRLSVVATAADPPTIEIGYNETVQIDVGMWDTVTDSGFEIWDYTKEEYIFSRRIVDFKVMEYPGGGNEQGAWSIIIRPTSIEVEKGTEIKSIASISLTSPPTGSNPIQSGILKIRVFDTWAFKSLFFPPRGHYMDAPIIKWMWFLGATVTMRYAKYSGTVETEYEDLNILVKVKPYHALRFDAIPLIRLNPDQITSVPVRLQNQGNYNDTYGFRMVSENNDIKLSAPYGITLAPGEIKNTYLGVSAPKDIFDYGTIHQITVEAYSIDDPNVTIAKRTIYFESRGLYISEIVGGSFVFLGILIILVIAFFIHRRRIFLDKFCVKPDKPWEVPKEKEYLDKLKKSNEAKYNDELKMMQDEYKSAILWYKYYCEKIIEPKPVKRIKKERIKTKKKKKPAVSEKSKEEIRAKKILIELMKKKEKEKQLELKRKEKEKIKQENLKQMEIKKEKKEEKQREKETRKIEKKKEKERQLKLKKIEDEKRKRQEVLLRIKKEQDKQKRKYG
jgi:hypothetical protein